MTRKIVFLVFIIAVMLAGCGTQSPYEVNQIGEQEVAQEVPAIKVSAQEKLGWYLNSQSVENYDGGHPYEAVVGDDRDSMQASAADTLPATGGEEQFQPTGNYSGDDSFDPTLRSHSEEPSAVLLLAGLAGASGSAVGPGGALFVTEGVAGTVTRVDPQTGEVTVFASGLPQSIIGIGGAIDVAFIGEKAYVLVTLVGSDVGGTNVVGIYRVDGPESFTIIADLGEYSVNNPPETSFDLPTGVQYAIETYRGGFLVTDGHHNRVLHVTLDGEVTDFIAFDNIVPTGLALSGNTIYMAETGPLPHLPQDGKVVSFEPGSTTATEVASGARLLVDVEFGRGRRLFALSQGVWEGDGAGSPALPNTGALMEVNEDGTFTIVIDGLNQPTSMEFIGNTAYVITLGGEVWKIENVSRPPFGRWH